MQDVSTVCTIRVGRAHYRELNSAIRQKIQEGASYFVLEGVMGQRYIGAGLPEGVTIEISGVPGQDLGVFNGGARIIVHGNAQDGVGNTMNEGFIVVHGNVGDIPGHMARSGKIYVQGSGGYRAGIMMKEYLERSPVMIIGRTLGDYAGEYMAGGTIIVLGMGLTDGMSPVSRHAASGIFGGKIFIRGKIEKDQLGKGAVLSSAGDADLAAIMPFIREYCEIFKLDINEILSVPFSVIKRAGQRPYGNLYVPSSAVSRDFRPIHRNVRAPCASACPVGIPNPVIIRKLREGKTQEAFDIIDDFTPFRYSCCGIICPGLCRAECSRKSLGEAVRIDEIARTYHPEGDMKVLEGPKDERVCIIGAGPSGLTAAWHLARRGYGVDVYERESDIGGKLTHSIPESRLPRLEVMKDLGRIQTVGIRILRGMEVDARLFGELRKKYNAVIIAVGAQKPKKIGFPGEEHSVSAFVFLRSIKVERKKWDIEGKSVVIVGAGNVAMDAACECFSFGASSVTAIDVRRPAAFGKELERALSLGTKLIFPRNILKYEDGVLYLTNGEKLGADFLIEAVGEAAELEFAGETFHFERGSFSTNFPDVYIIGDAAAPGLVTHSIGMGKKIAEYLHIRFRGLPFYEEEPQVVDKNKINTLYFQGQEPLTGVLDECFSCGTCIQCDLCIENCPRGAIRRTGQSFIIDNEICSGCGVCASVCPRGAITMAPVKP